MCQIRKELVAENAKIGQKDPSLVNVEGDTCYNNPNFKSDATPFQAETIAVSTMCENNSKNKQIVGVLVANKLCRTSSMLRNKGQHIQCPNHRGHCSANVSEREQIGDEGKYNKVLGDLISQDIKIANFTCDGDSRAFQGVRNSNGHNVGHLRDLRHLGNSLKHELNKAFSLRACSRVIPSLISGIDSLSRSKLGVWLSLKLPTVNTRVTSTFLRG
ncbi:hypothetical protein DPMN_027343 [Dreissena polymorpha]|uniref:Mutator-like transposase domain-containing protein n=1 Tax=Dreissena polymorpha TaxID=45954 RepID=A0A9D4LWT9_DREPO|nr:hypothetical protein DPMN_027343 [Dreissena polymorpha]